MGGGTGVSLFCCLAGEGAEGKSGWVLIAGAEACIAITIMSFCAAIFAYIYIALLEGVEGARGRKNENIENNQ